MIKDDDAKRNIHKERGGPGFSGYPTFPGGYPKNFVDDSYPGRWNYPPQPVDISDHFRSDNHLPLHDPAFCNCDANMHKQVSDNPTNYVSENKAKDDAQHLISDKADHFIRDYNDPSSHFTISLISKTSIIDSLIRMQKLGQQQLLEKLLGLMIDPYSQDQQHLSIHLAISIKQI